MILFSQVNKRVNKNIILKNINFYIKRNEFVFVYAKNREVIKTMAALLSGRQKADEGLIRINNKQSLSADFYRDIGIVHCDDFFLSSRNIYDNLKFILELFGDCKKYPEVRIKKMLDLVEIKNQEENMPAELMTHQYIRASIARAMLLYPSILVLEDPLLFLDEINSQAIFHLLKKINNKKITVVFLCSDQNYIRRNKSEKTIYLSEQTPDLKKEGYHV